MFGFSVYLNETIDLDYLESMKKAGFSGIFTSIHIPEDDVSLYLENLEKLGHFTKSNNLALAVDISEDALNKIGASLDHLPPVLDLGVTGLRIDYGIPLDKVAKASHSVDIMLNASTITEKDVSVLKMNQANFSRIEAWHNYYPRPETGLDDDYFKQVNQRLKQAGLKVMAFVPGDASKRGPIFEGLPTLESQRQTNPLAASLALKNHFAVTDIYIGDPKLSTDMQDKFEYYIHSDGIRLNVMPLLADREVLKLIEEKHRNRPDPARDVVRSKDARYKFASMDIPLLNTVERVKGTVTIDNEAYGRYKGEVQVTKRNLPADQKVNVIGRVLDSDLDLIQWIGPSQEFEFVLEEIDK